MINLLLIKFKSVIFRDYSELEILDLIRILNGGCLLIYYLFVLLPNFSDFYLPVGFISPDTFYYYPKSLLFSFFYTDYFMYGCFFATIFLLYTFTIGIYAKWSLVLLLPLHIGFHHANPFINHEPQPLSNLLLIITLFLPIENIWAVKLRHDIFPVLSKSKIRFILWMLLVYFSFYYFFAGLKKLPDPNWLNGSSVGKILSWPYMAKENFMTHFFKIPMVSYFSTYFTVFFEIIFIFIVFTRFRKLLIPLGLVFHLIIGLTMDVGHLFWAMISWYPLLLLTHTRGREGNGFFFLFLSRILKLIQKQA